MKILYTHAKGNQAEIPQGDTLAEYAVSAYGHCLNTPDRINRIHSGPEFAEAILECYCESNPRTVAVCNHVRSI